MVLAEFARLLDASPKWVLHTMQSLTLRSRYRVTFAERMVVARAIHDGFGTPLPVAFTLAQRALREWNGSAIPLSLRPRVTDDVALTIARRRGGAQSVHRIDPACHKLLSCRAVREVADRERIHAFMTALARRATADVDVFLVGGTSAVLVRLPSMLIS